MLCQSLSVAQTGLGDRATQFIDMVPLPLLMAPVGSHCKVPRFTGNAGLFNSTDPYISTTHDIRKHIRLWFSKASVPALLQASPLLTGLQWFCQLAQEPWREAEPMQKGT